MLKRSEIFGKFRFFQRSSPTRVICGSFFAVIILGALLLMLPFATRQGAIAPENAFFTATSATCVTGLVTVDTWQTFTLFGQLVILLLIQVGGLGLVTIVAFFNFAAGKRFGLRNMQLAGASAGTSEISSTKKQIRTIIRIALTFEAAGALLLMPYFIPRFGGEGIYISVFLSISAFCNAGFDILSRTPLPFTSLVLYSGEFYPLFIISLLIICGGLGFVVWHDLVVWRKTKHLMLQTKIVLCASLLLIAGGTIGIFLMETGNPQTLGAMDTAPKWFNAYFQSVSARTAGFDSMNCAGLHDVTKLFMSLLMFIGAASGSTGGGIKITTVAVLVVTVSGVIKGEEDTTIFGHKIDKQTVYKSLTIFLLGFFTLLVAAFTIYYNAGIQPNSAGSLFEAASAFATVGLSVGATPSMNLAAKIITMVTMFAGRCGPVALAASLTVRARTKKHLILPEGHIMVG